MIKKLLPVLLAVPATAACAYPSISEINNPPKVVEIKVVEKNWKCPGCNPNEQYVLGQLQKSTKIRDRNALATIMGNIKSESNFHANICEGGARVPYERCYRGGYGLIQWTTAARYRGLGTFARRYGCNPSALDCQTRYMINENQFRAELDSFKTPHQPVPYYMNAASYWLGWGIKGHRQQYAYNYTKKLVWA